ISTSSTSGWPRRSGAASGRTSTERRRGARRACSADTRGVVNTTSPRKLVCATSSAGPSRPCAPPGGPLRPLGGKGSFDPRGGPLGPPGGKGSFDPRGGPLGPLGGKGSLEPLGFIDE